MPRSKAFSGKQKKAQLQEKKLRKQGQQQSGGLRSDDEEFDDRTKHQSTLVARAGLNEPSTSGQGRNRYALKFRSETEESLKQSRKLSTKPIVPVCPEYLECQVDDFFTPELSIPIRPSWDYSLSREELDAQERRYFARYLQQIETAHEASMAELSYFELNLETWRQFWRVLEMSDILLCIIDIRYPALLFPPKLYEFVSQTLGKDIILVLNKIDLAPAPLVLAWREHFKAKYPKLKVICFTSYPSYNLRGNQQTKTKVKRTRGRMKMAAEGAMSLLQVCEGLVGTQLDLGSWKEKITAEMNDAGQEDAVTDIKIGTILEAAAPDSSYYEFKKFSGGILTLGCVGQPNVGKSSVINALMGKKVVSVSKTPGHTKHFQTIFLTPNVRLCDCPGLVFPSKVPKSLQVLCGSFPIAQLRDAISVVRYLGERLNLPKILQLNHPEGGGWNAGPWSAHDIAEGWAIKRGFFTAKASRPDSNRAANHILRLALDGRVCLCLTPPNYHAEQQKWSQDPAVTEIEALQSKSKTEDKQPEDDEGHGQDSDSDSDDSAQDGAADNHEAEENDSESEEAEPEPESDTERHQRESKPKTKTKAKSAAALPKVNVKNKFAMLEEAELE